MSWFFSTRVAPKEWINSGKNGFVISGIIRPYVLLFPYFSVVALPFGTNFVSSSTLRTSSAVAGRTRFDPLMTRDTVALDTPAIFAMSRISIVVTLPYSMSENSYSIDYCIRIHLSCSACLHSLQMGHSNKVYRWPLAPLRHAPCRRASTVDFIQ